MQEFRNMPSETGSQKLTPFQLSVYNELLKIPFGETRTYKQIAEALGKPKASRAVGYACNKNPFPFIVPCHRVVGSNGSLTGFAYGLDMKSNLLRFEKEVNNKVKNGTAQ